MPLSWPSFTVRDGWWRVKGVAVRAGWYCECIITSLWCGSRTVKETLRSLSNGPWPLDAGKSAFQVKSAPAWGGLLTLSHGGTVYAVTQEEWKHGAMTEPSQPLNTREQVMICKRAGEQFYNLQHHWNPVCLNLCFHCRPRQSLPDTLIIYYTSPLETFRKYFCIILQTCHLSTGLCAVWAFVMNMLSWPWQALFGPFCGSRRFAFGSDVWWPSRPQTSEPIRGSLSARGLHLAPGVWESPPGTQILNFNATVMF